MNNSREYNKARQDARQFGAPGLKRGVNSNKKTGKMSGYWRSGRIQWNGEFINGNEIGIWTYHGKSGKRVQELYFNL